MERLEFIYYHHVPSLTVARCPGIEPMPNPKNAYELGQYSEFLTKAKMMFTDKKIPTIEYLRERQTKLREQYAEISAEYEFYTKEADRLARQIQQKRDSQRTIDRDLQNEQATKRKKNQLE